jgi:hypothetical protein
VLAMLAELAGIGSGYVRSGVVQAIGRFGVRQMSTVAARRAQSIGRRITDARRARDRDKELRYRELAEAMIEKFGPNARREIEFGRRDQLKRTRG